MQMWFFVEFLISHFDCELIRTRKKTTNLCNLVAFATMDQQRQQYFWRQRLVNVPSDKNRHWIIWLLPATFHWHVIYSLLFTVCSLIVCECVCVLRTNLSIHKHIQSYKLIHTKNRCHWQCESILEPCRCQCVSFCSDLCWEMSDYHFLIVKIVVLSLTPHVNFQRCEICSGYWTEVSSRMAKQVNHKICIGKLRRHYL